jgi:hypothetical protein
MPLDEQECAGICNCRSADEIDAMRYILGKYFTRMEDGHYNHRMQSEVERSEAISSARSEAGRKGYEARAKRLPSKSQAIAKQVHLSPSPSPSLSQELNPPTPLPGGFVAFWNAWPQHHRKAAKPQCLRKWNAKGCEAMAGKVVAAVNAAKRSADWQKDGGAFIPAPLAWLNQERWEAPIQSAPEPPQAEIWKPPASLSPTEQAAANEARKAAMQAIKRVQT